MLLVQVPAGNVLLLLAHNGPEGLGSEPHSICGVDWRSEAGDWGDPDLAAVLQQLQEQGSRVSLVLHGHMHHMIKGEPLMAMMAMIGDWDVGPCPCVQVLSQHGSSLTPVAVFLLCSSSCCELAGCCPATVTLHYKQATVQDLSSDAVTTVVVLVGGARRQMVHIDPCRGTVHLNAATVPRVVTLPHSNGEQLLGPGMLMTACSLQAVVYQAIQRARNLAKLQKLHAAVWKSIKCTECMLKPKLATNTAWHVCRSCPAC